MNPHPTTDQINGAANAALFFRTKGWNALPSRMDRKGPAMASYADYWDKPVPGSTYDSWNTTNIQVMTGAHWKLCVVDCDGDAAHNVWKLMKQHYAATPIGPWPTWVARTGGGGWHYWFTLPAWIDECPSGRLWGVWDTFGGPKHQGDWKKHEEVRLLADRALVIAPPSLHVETGRDYHWISGRSPADYALPAVAPDWLLTMPRLSSPSLTPPPPMPTTPPPVKSSTRPPGAFYTREEVLAAIGDKVALASRWGLRFASREANPKGWCSVHALDRPDANPSASFSPSSGVYTEQRDGERLSLFDLAVRLGQYPDWETAKNALGDEFLGRPRSPVRTPAYKTGTAYNAR